MTLLVAQGPEHPAAAPREMSAEVGVPRSRPPQQPTHGAQHQCLPQFAYLQNGGNGHLATFATQVWNENKEEIFMKCFESQREQTAQIHCILGFEACPVRR